MLAAVLHSPGDLRLEERPTPEPGPDEVLVAVAYNGLCGTDVTEFTKGPMMLPLQQRHPGSGHVGPTVLGHEFVGSVAAVGRGAEAWLGRRVASGAGVSCGACPRCRRGRTNLCDRYWTLGLSADGALAEFVVVPAGTLRPIPDGCRDEEAALAQPLAVGLHAVAGSGIEAGDTVVLVGAGAIGSFILAGLAGHDGRVVAVDIDEARLASARALGATETVLIHPDDPLGPVRDVVRSGAEVVIEASGVTGAAQRAITLTARGGTTMLVGLTRAPQPLDLADVVLREITVRSSVAHVCDADLPRALELLTARPLGSLLVDRVVPLDRVVEDAFEPLATGTVGGKVLVAPRHG
ncbi:MAG: zinc-dependent alcohol dehydrogenase [Jatrophihabitans sp.]|uniref:zinc-dependent alcohol dehydrogenase n=1 Tax=Jatrophihabitans sp. TaxID=1932789 RepID=UPI003F7FC131